MGKITYERRVYESVNHWSLSSAMSRKLMGKIIQVVKGYRNIEDSMAY